MMRQISWLLAVAVFCLGCDEIQTPLESPEIVVIGNGMELASSGVADRLLVDVADEGRTTSLIVKEGSTSPAIQNSETGAALEVKVTDVVRHSAGSELIRVEAIDDDSLDGCEIFERADGEPLICREDLQDLPLHRASLPLVLTDDIEKAVFLSSQEQLRYGDQFNSVCLSDGSSEFFVDKNRLFFKEERQWQWLDLNDVQETADCDVESTFIPGDEIVYVAGNVFAFNWKQDSTDLVSGFYPIDIETASFGEAFWTVETDTKILSFVRSDIDLKDGSMIAEIEVQLEGSEDVQRRLIHLHPFLKRSESIIRELEEDSKVALSVGYQRLLIEEGDSRSACALLPRAGGWAWTCQPLFLDFEQRIQSVALDQEDQLVVALQGESDELWTLKVSDLSIVGREILRGDFTSFKKLHSGPIKKYNRDQSSHLGPEEKFPTSRKSPEK